MNGEVCHGSNPEDTLTDLMFLPVVERRSLPIRLASTLISRLVLLLKLLKKETYLASISVLAELYPQLRTCWTKKVRVCLGQSQASFTAVFQLL